MPTAAWHINSGMLKNLASSVTFLPHFYPLCIGYYDSSTISATFWNLGGLKTLFIFFLGLFLHGLLFVIPGNSLSSADNHKPTTRPTQGLSLYNSLPKLLSLLIWLRQKAIKLVWCHQWNCNLKKLWRLMSKILSWILTESQVSGKWCYVYK